MGAAEKHAAHEGRDLKGAARTFYLYKPLAELSEEVAAAYHKQLTKMVSEIVRYVERRIVLGPLDKADHVKPLITPHQLTEIRKIIEDLHTAFVTGTLGPDTVSPVDVQRLIDAGVLPADLAFTFHPSAGELPPAAMNYIEDAYYYGHMLAAATTKPEQDRLKAASIGEVRRRKPTIRLTAMEKHALDWAKHSAAIECRGLGNKVADDFSTTAIEADRELRRRYIGLIQSHLVENIQRRETWRRLASDLGHRTGDWARDFQRIAATEKQKAMQEGTAAGLVKKLGRPDGIFVAKQPNPDACPACIKLHLVAGPGSPPRIFKLSELARNGSNVGRRQADWKPGIGPVHPWCGCELIHVPKGWRFNEEGDLIPGVLERSDSLADLAKSMKDPPKQLRYKNVPEKGVVVRVGDPRVRAEVDRIISLTPKEIFDKRVGVTLVTTDIPRAQNPLDDHDLAYWTGNEIRLMQTLPATKIARVLPHELGHSLNVWLMGKMGGEEAVKKWHRKLWKISKREGFVTEYAKKLPIENAAEVTMLYLYDRPQLMLKWPRQFAAVHSVYRDIWRPS